MLPTVDKLPCPEYYFTFYLFVFDFLGLYLQLNLTNLTSTIMKQVKIAFCC